MNTTTKAQAVDPRDAKKDKSMLKQKEMIENNYNLLANAEKDGTRVSYTFVPGNLNELVMCFNMLGNYPEINSLQWALRKQTGPFIVEAERNGHSEDVCTYVKSDIGMVRKGNIGPTGKPIPKPDILLLSYTGCFTFMKWFELLRHEYKCETTMLHVPYQSDGVITDNMRNYVVKQLNEEVISQHVTTNCSATAFNLSCCLVRMLFTGL